MFDLKSYIFDLKLGHYSTWEVVNQNLRFSSEKQEKRRFKHATATQSCKSWEIKKPRPPAATSGIFVKWGHLRLTPKRIFVNESYRLPIYKQNHNGVQNTRSIWIFSSVVSRSSAICFHSSRRVLLSDCRANSSFFSFLKSSGFKWLVRSNELTWNYHRRASNSFSCWARCPWACSNKACFSL